MEDDWLFRPLELRGIRLKNRIMIAPMAMYSAVDGLVDDFHLVHLGRFALGGAGLVMMEATAISREGRITPGCAGIWSDTHVAGLRRISDFIRRFGAIPAIQLGHAGRKGACERAWRGGAPLPVQAETADAQRWPLVSSTGVPFEHDGQSPAQLDTDGINRVIHDFVQGASRADAAGFDVLEIHSAHGYLLHCFLSPLVNDRKDEWGGNLAGRMRFPLAVVRGVRDVWPQHKPLFVRISSVDGVGAGWSIDDSVIFARELKEIGVDVIDCSSGGMKLPRGARLVARTEGFHVPFAARIRREAGIPTIAVGLIRRPAFAAQVLERGDADIVALAREALVDPNWVNRAASDRDSESGWDFWPEQYAMWLRGRATIAARAAKDAESVAHSMEAGAVRRRE